MAWVIGGCKLPVSLAVPSYVCTDCDRQLAATSGAIDSVWPLNWEALGPTYKFIPTLPIPSDFFLSFFPWRVQACLASRSRFVAVLKRLATEGAEILLLCLSFILSLFQMNFPKVTLAKLIGLAVCEFMQSKQKTWNIVDKTVLRAVSAYHLL